jgi:hypothetical protein
MKTAMQELIEWLKEQRDRPMGQGAPLLMTQHVIAKCYECLEKEKEQIIEAYEDGKQNGIDSITNIHMYIIGEKYYNQTYNQDK